MIILVNNVMALKNLVLAKLKSLGFDISKVEADMQQPVYNYITSNEVVEIGGIPPVGYRVFHSEEFLGKDFLLPKEEVRELISALADVDYKRRLCLVSDTPFTFDQIIKLGKLFSQLEEEIPF